MRAKRRAPVHEDEDGVSCSISGGLLDTLGRLASLTLAPVSPKQNAMLIRKYLDKQDRQAVVALWKGACGYSAAHNDP